VPPAKIIFDPRFKDQEQKKKSSFKKNPYMVKKCSKQSQMK